jgi:hypothetical protein
VASFKSLGTKRGVVMRLRSSVGALAAAAVAVAAAVMGFWPATAAAAGAAADPTPAPQPGYQIQTPDGPVFLGAQVYPPWCLHNMTACGFRYDPGTATWQPKEGSQ